MVHGCLLFAQIHKEVPEALTLVNNKAKKTGANDKPNRT